MRRSLRDRLDENMGLEPAEEEKPKRGPRNRRRDREEDETPEEPRKRKRHRAWESEPEMEVRGRKERDAIKVSGEEEFIDPDEDIFNEAIKEEKQEKAAARRRKVGTVLISMASLYVIFLIYGATLTDFSFGESGQVEPVVMNSEEIAARQDFNVVLSLYIQTRNIYEEVLTLDYRVAVGQEAMEAIAPDYQSLLERALTLAATIDGTSTSAENQQIKNLLYTWTATYLSDYCKYMITALSQNGTAEGEAAGEEAIACRSNYLEPNFQSITQNVITIGSTVKGVDLTDAKSWDPSTVTDRIQGLDEQEEQE